MESISERIRRATRDLLSIQEDLNWIAKRDPGHLEHIRKFQQELEVGLMNDFKSAVDHTRHALWNYVEVTTGSVGTDVERALQTYRMQRVTDMLRVLRQQGEPPDVAETPEGRSFLEEIQAVAATTVDRHIPPPKPAAKGG